MKIVVDDAIAEGERAFGGFGDVVGLPGRAIAAENAAVADADALIVRTVTRVDDRLLDAMPRVRFVGTATAGSDHLDLEALARRGIVVVDAAGCNARAVAEWVIVALLGALPQVSRAVAAGPLGVVGVGHVGALVARLARRLGHQVLCCDPPRARRGDVDEEWVTLDELWSRASIVTLHVPLIKHGPDRTLGMIDGDVPRHAGPKLLINTSRGAVVRQAGLARADVEARVLDVFEHEPELDWGTLLDGRSLRLSPHVAGYSLEAKLRASEILHAAMAAWLGRPTDFHPVAALPSLRVDTRGVSTLDVLHRVIDQPGDDRRLRSLEKIPESERAAAFEQLRHQYAWRREFAHCVVDASARNDVLRALDVQAG